MRTKLTVVLLLLVCALSAVGQARNQQTVPLVNYTSMTSSDPNYGGPSVWSNPSGVTSTISSVYAYLPIAFCNVGHTCAGPALYSGATGFAIPSNATITGVIIQTSRRATLVSDPGTIAVSNPVTVCFGTATPASSCSGVQVVAGPGGQWGSLWVYDVYNTWQGGSTTQLGITPAMVNAGLFVGITPQITTSVSLTAVNLYTNGWSVKVVYTTIPVPPTPTASNYLRPTADATTTDTLDCSGTNYASSSMSAVYSGKTGAGPITSASADVLGQGFSVTRYSARAFTAFQTPSTGYSGFALSVNEACSNITGFAGACGASYSTDGGSTWTQLFLDVTGSTTQVTQQIVLAGVTVPNLQVRVCAQGVGGSVGNRGLYDQQIFDIWVTLNPTNVQGKKTYGFVM